MGGRGNPVDGGRVFCCPWNCGGMGWAGMPLKREETARHSIFPHEGIPSHTLTAKTSHTSIVEFPRTILTYSLHIENGSHIFT